MTAADLRRLCDRFVGPNGDEALLEHLRLAPEEAVQGAARDLGLSLRGRDARFVSHLLIESIALATEASVGQRERSNERIEASLRSLRRAHLAWLFTNGLLALTGLALIVLAAVQAFRGEAVAAAVTGGLGIVEVAVALWQSSVRHINESAVELTQLRIVYASYMARIDQLALRYEFLAETADIPVKAQIADALHWETERTLELIERHIEGGQ